MKATPIIPGKLYRVIAADLDVTVIAAHPVDALLIGLDLSSILQKELNHG